MNNYFYGIWKSRYFWIELVKADLRIKYRRSTLGMVWTLLHPLLLTCLLGVVFGAIFKSPFANFAPFVYSGLITWDFIISAVTTGTNCIINAEAYIRQFKHPLAIYTLKQALVVLINYLVAGVGLLLWCWVMYPANILISILALPISIVFLFLIAWPLTTFSGFINTKFRDFQQLIIIVLQALWFVSPVYFEPKIFIQAGLPGLVEYNPVTHILNLIRKPLIDGVFPSVVDYGYVLVVILVITAFSIIKIINEENDMIFYL